MRTPRSRRRPFQAPVGTLMQNVGKSFPSPFEACYDSNSALGMPLYLIIDKRVPIFSSG